MLFRSFVIVRLVRNRKGSAKILLTTFVVFPIVSFYLIAGGVFGLEEVKTHQWGGLTLTLVIASVGILVSFPIGILLALGRQSNLRVISFFSTIYIEFIRAVPLITILFMASFVLPLFFTGGVDFEDRKSTRLNSSRVVISYAVFCLKKKKTQH